MASGKLHCAAPGCNATMDTPQHCGKAMKIKGLFSKKLACAMGCGASQALPQHCGKPCKA
ncbi:MAG: hypothetical protein QXO51_01730 [Halobacteria archaeon]